MPAEVTETMDQDTLLTQFRTRYESLVRQNQELAKQIKENEVTAFKLQGAIETLEYLGGNDEGSNESTEEAAE